MTNRTIKYEIKLQPSVIIILGILALGVCAYAFSSIFSVKKADSAFGGGDEMILASDDGYIWQLKSGKVRYCFRARPNVGCSNWSAVD